MNPLQSILDDAWAEYQTAQKHITEHGEIVKLPKTGEPIANPYCAIRDKAAARAQRALRDLGVDPASEAVGTTPAAPKNERETLARLGYTSAEINARLERWDDMAPEERGHLALADQIREAVVSAALGGCKESRHRVEAWIKRQARQL